MEFPATRARCSPGREPSRVALTARSKTPGGVVAAVCDRRNRARMRSFFGAHRAPLQFLNGLLAERRAPARRGPLSTSARNIWFGIARARGGIMETGPSRNSVDVKTVIQNDFFSASRSEGTMVAVGFSPRDAMRGKARREATLEGSPRFKRRYATHALTRAPRGLKPTATVVRS